MQYISKKELVELIEKAKQLGLSLEPGSDLEKLSIKELQRLVTYKC